MKKNGFFVAAGVLSILEAVGLVIAAFLMLGSLAIFNSGWEIDPSMGNMTQEEFEIYLRTMRTMLVIFAIVFVVLSGVAIFNATVYLKNSNKTYAQLHEMSGKIITVIVLSFIAGGLIVGGIGLAGYLFKTDEETNENSTSYNVSTKSEEVEKKLQQLKDMRDNGIISNEEYNKAREEVLKNF